MELLYVTVIGTGIGLVARYTIPGRHKYGVLLVPGVAGSVTAAVWAALVWAGLSFDGGWIWVASIGAAIVASVLLAALLPRRRESDDARMLQRLLARKA